MDTKLIAIDAGWGGAVAWWIKSKDRLGLRDCPGDYTGIVALLSRLTKRYGSDGWEAVIEANTPSPKFGARGNFGLGLNVGAWCTAFAAFSIPVVDINPKMWQKMTVNIKSRKKKGREARKEKAWRYARQCFPKFREQLGDDVPHPRRPEQGRADALCILDWGRKWRT